jgi:uncharacterized membrane protein YsdA (DUF1294 family)
MTDRTTAAFTWVALVLVAFGVALGMRLSMPWVFALLAGINGATLVLYGYDKAVAGGNRVRVPERVLQGLALLGGSPAALIGQQLFRHKTAKAPFQKVFWIIVILQLVALGAWVWCWKRRPEWIPPSLRILFPD